MLRLLLLVTSLVLATACGQTRAPWDRGEESEHDSDGSTKPPTSPKKPEPGDPGDVGEERSPLDLDIPGGDAALTNLSDLIQEQGLAAYHRAGHRGQDLKIAVLDNGFVGLNRSLGKRLPPDTKLAKSPLPDMQQTNHGLKLAEIVYALATGSTKYQASRKGPEILLFNTNGFTNLRAAIDQVIEQKVDIVLYAQVWEYGGNFDGKGFINREVKRATDAGILWVNAAGNVGKATYNGPIEDGKTVRFTVAQSGTPIKAVLSWNDFDESKDYQTSQDLDMTLTDSAGSEVGAGRLRQLGSSGEDEKDFSAHAREIINATLRAGTYTLKVEQKSQNFDDTSKLRISIDGHHVRMLDGTEGESLLIPADNPAVLTIGATDVDYSAFGTLADGTSKPEMSVKSEVRFADGSVHYGTSAASAIAVGMLAVYASANGTVSREDVLRLVAGGAFSSSERTGTDR